MKGAFRKCKTSLLCALFLCVIFSCKDNKMETEISEFCKHQVSIPSEKMIRKYCSHFRDSSALRQFTIVDYTEAEDCSNCSVSKIAALERESETVAENGCKASFVHIVRVHPDYADMIYKELCYTRIRGLVYLDTCNAFVEANPHLPSSPMLHTFVINESGNVLLVGNPFACKSMLTLYEKITSKQLTKRRKSKTTK